MGARPRADRPSSRDRAGPQVIRRHPNGTVSLRLRGAWVRFASLRHVERYLIDTVRRPVRRLGGCLV